MPRRTGDAKTTAKIVMASLQGRPVAELGTEDQSSQAPYDPWRDQWLAPAGHAVEIPQHHRKEARLVRENARVNALVGELTVAFKKSDAGWGSHGTGRSRSPSATPTCSHGSSSSRPSPHFGATAGGGRTCTSWSSCRSTRSACCACCESLPGWARPTCNAKPSGRRPGAHRAPPHPTTGGPRQDEGEGGG